MVISPTTSLNAISLCTGGAGLDLALDLAIPGTRTVCMVEREAFAVAQLVSAMEAGHLGSAPIWSDVRTFDGRPWRGLVDGLIGGIPCQPHSLAGRKRGQLDGRDLWSDARRIVATARPWFVLIENVSGMLSAGDDEVAGAERVWRDLRKLGYAVEGGLFTAAEVGASHERERVFILAVADRESDQRWSELETRRERSGRPGPTGGSDSPQGVGLADTHGTRSQGRRDGATGRQGQERYAGLGSGEMVNAAGERRGERRPEPELRSGRNAAAGADSQLADTDFAELRGEPPAGQQSIDEFDARSGIFPPGPNDIAGWRDTLARSPELEPAFRRVADGLASRMDIARVDRLRLLGNGVVPLEGAYAIRTLATRLAERGAPGADELVRLMENLNG